MENADSCFNEVYPRSLYSSHDMNSYRETKIPWFRMFIYPSGRLGSLSEVCRAEWLSGSAAQARVKARNTLGCYRVS